MAYTAPPNFTAGSVLSAAQMNILSDDIEYLYGIVGGPTPAVNAVYFEDTDGEAYWAFRYKWRYLHFKYVLSNTGDNDPDYVKYYIYDNSNDYVQIFADGSPDRGETVVFCIDLLGSVLIEWNLGGTAAGDPWNLTMSTGNIYTVKLEWNHRTGNHAWFHYVINSDKDSL